MKGVYYPRAVMILTVRWEDAQYKTKAGTNADTQRTDEITVYPKSVRVEINSYQEADTFSAELDYKSFPFDPRTIRSCVATIYMANFQGEYKANLKDAVFVGFADEESITLDDSGRTIRLEGRDYTSLFIDNKYTKGTLPLNKNIKQHVQDFIDAVPGKGAEKITIDARVTDAEMPKLSKFGSGTMNVKDSENYWGLIQDIAARTGVIVYVELDKVVISKPRVLYKAVEQAAQEINNKEKAISFIYGKNLKSLEYKKKIGRRKGFNLVVRSMHPWKKIVIEAKLPMQGTAAWSKDSGIPNVEVKIPDVGKDGQVVPLSELKPAPYVGFTVADIDSHAQLVEIGQQAYEAMAREQIEGSLETYDMEATQVNKAVFDLLKLRMGTPLKVEIDQEDIAALSTDSDTFDKVKFLKSRGYSAKVAGALAANLSSLSNFMYTKSVGFDMSATSFKIKVNFINFVETTISKGKK